MNLARSLDVRSVYPSQFYFYTPEKLYNIGFNKMNSFSKVSNYTINFLCVGTILYLDCSHRYINIHR